MAAIGIAIVDIIRIGPAVNTFTVVLPSLVAAWGKLQAAEGIPSVAIRPSVAISRTLEAHPCCQTSLSVAADPIAAVYTFRQSFIRHRHLAAHKPTTYPVATYLAIMLIVRVTPFFDMVCLCSLRCEHSNCCCVESHLWK